MDSYGAYGNDGGLAGTSPEDAYSIHIGLGDTMTPEEYSGRYPQDIRIRGYYQTCGIYRDHIPTTNAKKLII